MEIEVLRVGKIEINKNKRDRRLKESTHFFFLRV